MLLRRLVGVAAAAPGSLGGGGGMRLLRRLSALPPGGGGSLGGGGGGGISLRASLVEVVAGGLAVEGHREARPKEGFGIREANELARASGCALVSSSAGGGSGGGGGGGE